MVVSAREHDEMDRGMSNKEEGPGERLRPIVRPPRPQPERQSGGEKCRTDILYQMRVEWPGLCRAGHAGPPGGTGTEHCKPVGGVKCPQNSCKSPLHG